MFNSKYQDDSSKSPGFLFIKAYNKWYSEIQRTLHTIGLTHPQLVILTVIAYFQNQGEHPTQKMVSDHSSIDVMTTSQILRLLEKKQYIQRVQHPTDTRAKIIVLLDTGQEKVNQGIPLIENIDALYFGKLKNDLPVFMDFLYKLTL
jgi:MarR family transcriptional regulator, temperature-dependent positive regulator of motility